MIATTLKDREQELRSLLDQISNHPERDWTLERERVLVLQRMIAGAQRSSAAA